MSMIAHRVHPKSNCQSGLTQLLDRGFGSKGSIDVDAKGENMAPEFEAQVDMEFARGFNCTIVRS